jgi:siroheme synthase-like protein
MTEEQRMDAPLNANPDAVTTTPAPAAGVRPVAEALFPAFLRLSGRRVVVVGGGPVAASKLAALVAAGAEVTVVAPEIVPEIVAAGVRVERRAFRPEDLEGAWFVVAAAPPEVNREVARSAGERRLFVNAVDDPASASAYLGGVVRKGGLTIALSTDGTAPALAGLLREGLEALLPDELGRWLDLARSLRPEWKAAAVPMSARRPLLLEALNRLYLKPSGESR